MATANSTRHSAGSSLSAQSDEFGALLRRLLISINHVRLVAQHFGDLSELSAEDAPAGTTLYQAAADLEGLHNELDAWDVRYEHVPKSPATGPGLGMFTDDGPARTPLTGMPPALPCPFCGRHDDIMVSQIKDASHAFGAWFRASCGACGVDAPGADTLLQAADEWNNRPSSKPPSATSESVVEADSGAQSPFEGGAVMSQYKPRPDCNYFHLDEPDDQPSTLRVIQALRGVCSTIEQLAESDNSMSLELGTAADILSEMIQGRVMSGPRAITGEDAT